jgi:D-glycero-D-manno-heptose 1,7-bisphosphate phosphatase
MPEVKRAVFLDRDGVLTRALVRDGRPFAPLNLEEFEILDGAAPALARLKRAGFVLLVVTNQPDVDRGRMTPETLEAMHAHLRASLPLDDILVCRCGEDDPDCACYKPRPGLLLDAAARWKIDLTNSFMVGDRWRDIGAGRAAGCRTVFIERHYARDRRPDNPDVIVAGLAEACKYILT